MDFQDLQAPPAGQTHRKHATSSRVQPTNSYAPSQSYAQHSAALNRQYAALQASSAYGPPLKKRKASSPDCEVIDLTVDTLPKQRTAKAVGMSNGHENLEDDEPATNAKKTKKQRLADLDVYETLTKQKKPKKPKDEEKRLRRWRKAPPGAYLEVKDRALTQRMFALDRKRDTSNPDHPTETVSLAGTTGNIYTIVVDKVPFCDCPHARKGNQCKHVAYVLSRVLRVRADLEYQLAFLSSELREIFELAPPLPSETAAESSKDGNRKRIEGECPICCVDFESDSGEQIVYCKTSCGNNIHKDCMNQWAASKRGGSITCPFCRSQWQGDEKDVSGVAKDGAKNAEGYVNVASQLGLSGRRDYSSYHSYWVQGQAKRGSIG